MIGPLLRSRLTLDVHGVDELGTRAGPLVVVANYASPADARLVLAALPRRRRHRLVVCLPPDAGRRPTWVPPGRTVEVGETSGRTAAEVVEQALADGRSVLCFPEDVRSRDGFLGTFRPEIVDVPLRRGVPVLPTGLRGSYAAVPDDSRRPVRGRPRVSVRFGNLTRGAAGESAEAYAVRLEQEVRRLIAEDASSWWQTQLDPGPATVEVPGSSWRRIWEQTEAPTAGGRPRRPKIWRS